MLTQGRIVGNHRRAFLAWAVTAAALAGLAGCEAGQQAIDSQRILGKWKLQGGGTTLEFYKDGTLREERINTGKGTYKFLDGGRLHMEVEGVLWGTHDINFKYQISGNELSLTPDNGGGRLALTLRYVRAELTPPARNRVAPRTLPFAASRRKLRRPSPPPTTADGPPIGGPSAARPHVAVPPAVPPPHPLFGCPGTSPARRPAVSYSRFRNTDNLEKNSHFRNKLGSRAGQVTMISLAVAG